MNGLQINWDTDMGLYTDIHMLQQDLQEELESRMRKIKSEMGL